MQGRRVAVTGIGVVSPVGIGREAFWQGLLSPQPTGHRAVHDCDPAPYFDNPKEARRADRFTQLAIAAADEAHRTWSKSTTVEERAALIRRAAELHRERRQELAEIIVREMEEGMLAEGSHTARYVTKLRKDLVNDINYILVKVNGRISDAVNGMSTMKKSDSRFNQSSRPS